MAYNYSNNHEDNFQDESAEIIGYCSICDSEIKATDKYYHYYDYDMICPNVQKGIQLPNVKNVIHILKLKI